MSQRAELHLLRSSMCADVRLVMESVKQQMSVSYRIELMMMFDLTDRDRGRTGERHAVSQAVAPQMGRAASSSQYQVAPWSSSASLPFLPMFSIPPPYFLPRLPELQVPIPPGCYALHYPPMGRRMQITTTTEHSTSISASSGTSTCTSITTAVRKSKEMFASAGHKEQHLYGYVYRCSST